MSAAAASAQPAIKPCGRTQSKLDELLKGADKGEARFERFFFTATPPRHLAHLHINDDLVRCLECGCTIGEHPPDVPEPPAKKSRTERKPFVWDKSLYANVKNATMTSLTEEQIEGSEKKKLRRVRFLKTAGGMPWFGAETQGVLPPDELLLRKWHVDLWEARNRLQTDNSSPKSNIIVIGTPGIGKSIALNYLLYMYLNAAKKPAIVNKRYVAMILPNAGKYYVFDTKGEAACAKDIVVTPWTTDDLIPLQHDLFVLHDLGNDSPMTPKHLPTVVATSPKLSKYHEFAKGNSREFYVPLLESFEMTALSKKVAPSFSYHGVWPGVECKRWQDAAFYYGNVPRNVFSTRSDQEKIVDQLRRLSFSQLKDLNGLPTTEVNDWLVELIPVRQDYTSKTYRYRPGYVTDEIAFKQLVANLDEWEKIVQFTTSGHMFETVLHWFLAKFPEKLHLDQMWELHPRAPPAPLAVTAELRTFWPTADAWRSVPFSSDQVTSLQPSVYYYPMKPNFAVVDSFLFLRSKKSKKKIALLCFQMTLQRSHETTGEKLQAFITEFNSRFTLDGLKLNLCLNASRTGLSLAATPPSPEQGAAASYDLELHLIYLTKEEKFFAHQKLKGGSATDRTIWSCIKQYRYSTKCLCSK
jgi:hypothetical protein